MPRQLIIVDECCLKVVGRMKLVKLVNGVLLQQSSLDQIQNQLSDIIGRFDAPQAKYSFCHQAVAVCHQPANRFE